MLKKRYESLQTKSELGQTIVLGSGCGLRLMRNRFSDTV